MDKDAIYWRNKYEEEALMCDATMQERDSYKQSLDRVCGHLNSLFGTCETADALTAMLAAAQTVIDTRKEATK